ncbi:MAG: SIMPL domain-containing protein [Clostridia bacterium]|nr:SIMPL domain-containing protein [Clostridia bacterium]
MQKTVTVRGTAVTRTAPDRIEIAFGCEGADKEHRAAAEKAAKAADALRAAVRAAGFAGEEMKTASFDLSPRFESVRTEGGEYRQVFTGFVCSYRFRLAFPFDREVLSRAVTALLSSGTAPELNVSFTVSDPEKKKEELLAETAKNARKKAGILAAASGCSLGSLLSVSYGVEEPVLRSPTSLRMAKAAVNDSALFSSSLTPEEIELTDSASFVWELL